MGYSHAGHLLLFRRGGIRAYYLQSTSGTGYASVPDSDWIPSVFDYAIWEPEFVASLVKSFLDHSPWNYNRALEYAVRDGTYPTKFRTYSGSSRRLPKSVAHTEEEEVELGNFTLLA